jgi:hypothetical protein
MTRGYPARLWISASRAEFSLSRYSFPPGSVKTMDTIPSEPNAIEEIARLLVEHAEEACQ